MAARRSHLAAMGIDVWRLRKPRAAVAPASAEPARAPVRVVEKKAQAAAESRVRAVAEAQARPVARVAIANDAVAGMDWETLRRTVAACRACGLHEGRTQTVFGVGNTEADWLFIGEAPGAEEDRQGEPFVGRAGQLLNSILFAIGTRRERVYIANVLKCRPPRNRDPQPEEARCCRPYLDRQITLIAPKIIVGLGRIAAQQLLQTDTPIGRLRGRLHHYALGGRRIPLVVTYHPAYLLRSPHEKSKVWEDLQFARRVSDGNA
jgi:DNA polymerase